MPYVKQNKRVLFARIIDAVRTQFKGFEKEIDKGDINYIITCIMKEYINIKGKSYSTSNDLVGILECAKLELYRRFIAPYEDEKIKENGDVY